MQTYFGSTDDAISHSGWPLLFAREPEEEADYDDLPETQEERPTHGSTVRRSVPPRQKKPSNMRPLILLLMFLVVAGLAYVSMTPGAMPPFLAEMLGFGSSEAPTLPPPSGTAKPAVPAQRPLAQTPAVPSPAPAPGAEAQQATAGPAAAPVTEGAVPSPLYGEGQKVFVALDPALPVQMMVLSGDSSGSKPGPSVRPGAAVTVLDAEYQTNGWIYSIRTPEGSMGWISEKRLKATL